MVRLMGGLGNQMFQYAFGRSMALKNNTGLVLDQTLLMDKSAPHEIATHRDYALDIFTNLKFRWASPKEIFAFNGDPKADFMKKLSRKLGLLLQPKKLVIQEQNKISPEYLFPKTDTCFVGRWQSYKFFEENAAAIREDFKLEKPLVNGFDHLLNNIQASESICLHVRRGDLVTSSLYSSTIGTLSKEYYTKAIGKLNSTIPSGRYFVFSDDINWCKQNIFTGKETEFVSDAFSGKKAEGHLFLMTQCKHFIISNSTFAWWGAYLAENKNKQVIYPANWYKDPALQNPEMCPPSWQAL